MKRSPLGRVCFLVVLLLAAALSDGGSPAHACSSEETLRQRIDRAVVVAEGWVEGYRLRPDIRHLVVGPGVPKVDQNAEFGLVPVEVVIRIERVVWGDAAE